ncbi:ABC transporter permease [Brumimicrobium salinarum]|uniref:ABC transporter permease n=1 Tax=Brumimicrobium salinarum TaxID=2058658 RepID=A0A2I0R4V3_9FLAO|nr:ABC transporter permease subunit [Brumimicrobium salinarum]PKR81605.1 ABC transporter permease [Brumimicrobium salinarum]
MILDIFKKELKDTLRDRRTIIAMIVVPVLVFPLLLGLSTTVTKYFADKQKEEVLKIAVVSNTPDNLFTERLSAIPDSLGPKEIFYRQDTLGLRQEINEDSLQLAFIIPPTFDSEQQQNQQSTVAILHKGVNLGNKGRITTYLSIIENTLLEDRFERLSLDKKLIKPIHEQFIDMSSKKEIIGKVAGGFLPYLFVIFGFIGCMYPAIDLFTGEKERKTLETLLTTPVPRWKILIGKMMVISLSGIAAAAFALLGMFAGLRLFSLVDLPGLSNVIDGILTPQFILGLLALLIPLTIFFAGIMIPATIYAKSFKEAQSVLTPVNFIVLLPAFVGMLPNIELDYTTALIPIVNIVLATKEIVAGTIDPVLLIISYAIMLIAAAISVIFSYKRFGKESNILS